MLQLLQPKTFQAKEKNDDIFHIIDQIDVQRVPL